MKGFSSEQLEALNAKSSTGNLVEAVIFTRDQSDPSTKDYFVRFERSIKFDGNTYTPLDMVWSGMKVTTTMELPNNQVVVNNLGGRIIDYIEDNNINIDGNDVVLQVLFIDKYQNITLIDEMLYQVEIMVADYHKTATFHLGVNYSLTDIVPRNTLETQEFPGLRSDVIRVGT